MAIVWGAEREACVYELEVLARVAGWDGVSRSAILTYIYDILPVCFRVS